MFLIGPARWLSGQRGLLPNLITWVKSPGPTQCKDSTSRCPLTSILLLCHRWHKYTHAYTNSLEGKKKHSMITQCNYYHLCIEILRKLQNSSKNTQEWQQCKGWAALTMPSIRAGIYQAAWAFSDSEHYIFSRSFYIYRNKEQLSYTNPNSFSSCFWNH